MDCIIGIDSKGRIQSFNPAAERCFGQTAGAIINRSFFKLFTRDRVQELNSASLDEGFLLTSGWVLERRNMTELQRYDGESFPAEVVVTRTVSIASEPLEYTLHIRDLSEQTKLQKRLETLAFNDSLTGLYNRAAFIRELERRINYHKSHAGVVALMFLDLDRFKKVNDVFGHKVGDQLLCEVGKRLSGVVRGNDLVGRWGGDEFVVAISGALDEEAINSKATEILHVTVSYTHLTLPTKRIV